jgi:hypothetical protein
MTIEKHALGVLMLSCFQGWATLKMTGAKSYAFDFKKVKSIFESPTMQEKEFLEALSKTQKAVLVPLTGQKAFETLQPILKTLEKHPRYRTVMLNLLQQHLRQVKTRFLQARHQQVAIEQTLRQNGLDVHFGNIKSSFSPSTPYEEKWQIHFSLHDEGWARRFAYESIGK